MPKDTNKFMSIFNFNQHLYIYIVLIEVIDYIQPYISEILDTFAYGIYAIKQVVNPKYHG